jgi:hypothetical protein
MESARKNDTCAYGKKNQIGWIAPYTLAQISGEIFFVFDGKSSNLNIRDIMKCACVSFSQ